MGYTRLTCLGYHVIPVKKGYAVDIGRDGMRNKYSGKRYRAKDIVNLMGRKKINMSYQMNILLDENIVNDTKDLMDVPRFAKFQCYFSEMYMWVDEML